MSFGPARAPSHPVERRHFLLPACLFGVLGFHVGVRAVLMVRLVAALHLTPGALGAAIGAAAAAGVVTLVFGGRLADRFGRRPVLLAGFGGTAISIVLLAFARSPGVLPTDFAVYGLTSSFIDLGANTVGSDHERAYDRPVMMNLHAGFSLGALLGALLSTAALRAGVGFRAVYVLLAMVLAGAALAAAHASLPPRTLPPVPILDQPLPGLWRLPGIALAMSVMTVTFFGDGALESFLGVYLASWHTSGVLLVGIGIGGFHLASFIGRLVSYRAELRWGQRTTLLTAGMLAALGITVVVMTSQAAVVVAGLLAAGFAIAPIVPAALSLAGRSAPNRSGEAVAKTTAAGYSAFIVGPVLIGRIADVTGLRTALALLIGTSLTVVALAIRWPARL